MIFKYAFHVCLSQPPLAFCLDSFIFKLIFFIWLINLVYHKPAFEGSHEPLSTIFRGLSITSSLFYTSVEVLALYNSAFNVSSQKGLSNICAVCTVLRGEKFFRKDTMVKCPKLSIECWYWIFLPNERLGAYSAPQHLPPVLFSSYIQH